MSNYLASRTKSLSQLLNRIGVLCLVVALLAVSATAQITIKIPGIKKPQPTKPQPTNSPSTTLPNPNGSKTPSSVGNGNRIPGNTGTGATREEVQAFQRDMRPYFKGMGMIRNMAKTANTDHPVGCSTAANTRKAMDDAAAFHEIIKQKYPNIENPSWANDGTGDSDVGDWRRYAENRVEHAKGCINATLGAVIRSLANSLDEDKAQIKLKDGFVLSRDFDDPGSRHTRLSEKYKEIYAVVGMSMQDDSVFAMYDSALEALVSEARKHAGEWTWPGTGHDAMIEARARGWFAKFDPKGQITKIGMMHSAWQIDGPSGGIPKGRYKRGYIMYRKPGFQPCIVASFNYEQNYIGGGKFNDMAITSGMGQMLRLQDCK